MKQSLNLYVVVWVELCYEVLNYLCYLDILPCKKKALLIMYLMSKVGFTHHPNVHEFSLVFSIEDILSGIKNSSYLYIALSCPGISLHANGYFPPLDEAKLINLNMSNLESNFVTFLSTYTLNTSELFVIYDGKLE